MLKLVLRFFIGLVFTLALITLNGCFGGRPLHEGDYQRYWCDRHHGEAEYRLADGTRIDCLTRDYAVEVEYAAKWAEAIGQSLFYARMTERKPGIVLIMREHGDERFLRRLRKVSGENKIKVWTIKPGDID